MQLPPELRAELEAIAERYPVSQLQEAAGRLSTGYRERNAAGFSSDLERVAYLLTRFPATYAACHAAMNAVRQISPHILPVNMLDLGSGPGTAVAAAARVFPELTEITAIESDRAIAMLSNATITRASLTRRNEDLSAAQFGKADLVTASYVLGELAEGRRAELIAKAWAATEQLLLVIEPGTPEGYRRVLDVRTQLLAAGAQMVAPCPHAERCPMQGTKDWCHFAARVERTSLHRRLKGGALGHEDEKFSYVAFARSLVRLPQARIVRHPWMGSGMVQLELCVDGEAIRKQTVTKSRKDDYRLARKAQWGDSWPPLQPILNNDAE